MSENGCEMAGFLPQEVVFIANHRRRQRCKMSVELHFNDRRGQVAPGASLFDYADSLGVKVPTSCHKQGKCKECLVEITEGMEFLSKPVPEEKHLKDNFRLSCRCHVIAASGLVRCQTMR